jgi:hypothetical protein
MGKLSFKAAAGQSYIISKLRPDETANQRKSSNDTPTAWAGRAAAFISPIKGFTESFDTPVLETSSQPTLVASRPSKSVVVEYLPI